MKITVNTLGTRGDVQPYIALSLGLKQAGHTVRVLTHQIFESFVEQYGLDLYPLQLDPRQVLIQQALAELGNKTLRIAGWLKENFASALSYLFEATLDASQDADLMVNSGLSFAGWHVAEKLQIPAVAAYLWPVTPSRYMPGATGKIPPAWLPFRGPVNYLATKLSNQLFFFTLLPLVNQCRRELLNLEPMTARQYWPVDSAKTPTPLIYGYSPSVVPKPPDWSNHQQITGYWFLDTAAGYQPEPQLLDFLAKGPPPVMVGFGSVVEHELQAVNSIVTEALRETGQRGILLGGWSGTAAGDLPDFIFGTDAVPHDWLFPRLAAAVHHGGAGTTAAALRAGLPGVIVPWFADQFFWGWRVQELAVAPRPVPRQELTVARLAAAIQQAVQDEEMRSKAARLGERIRAERGVENAVALIEGFARNGHL